MNPFAKSLFADTSFFYACLDSKDANHGLAQDWSEDASRKNMEVITSWEVIVETVTLLRTRHSFLASHGFIENIVPCLRIIYPDDPVRKRSLTLFKKFAQDKRLSLCDVISFVLVKEHLKNIPCLAFDDDFTKLGLTLFAA